MRKHGVVETILPKKYSPVAETASAFAPVNFALAKYWGKRDEELLLPVTDSFSVAIEAGTTTTVSQAEEKDIVVLNGKEVEKDLPFYKRLVAFLDLFRPASRFFFSISTTNSIPTAAGLASSASGFAALVLALNSFFGWNLSQKELSILSRLGSGSACRSIYSGFVQWNKGEKEDGMDSFAEPFDGQWDEMRFGICMVSKEKKPIDSRTAMQKTVSTSPLYAFWPENVQKTISQIKGAIQQKNFSLFGSAIEQNALAMHATMFTTLPPICYWQEGSLALMKRIWKAREEGVDLYFTMDAGPNIKLLFLRRQEKEVLRLFPEISLLSLLF